MTTDAFAASYLQESLYQAADNGESAVNVGVLLELHGPLDLARLLGAIDQVTDRHEALRTTLATVDGDVCQVIAPSAEVPAVVIDLLAEDEPSAEAMRLIRGHLRRPFALGGPSLCRVMVIACAPDRHFLALSLHHAIMDGWSVNVLVAELRACYQDAGAVPGAQPPLQPADYAEWERQTARSAFTGDWRERLSGHSPRVRIPGATGPGPGQLSVARELPGERADAGDKGGTGDGAYRLARRLRVPVAAVFAAAVAASLREYAAPGLTIGLVRANRERAELRDVLGYLADITPLPIDLRGDPEFGSLVDRAADALAFSRERPVPLAALAPLLRADGDGGPLFDVCLNYLPAPAAAGSQGQQRDQAAGELRMTSVAVPDDEPAASRWWDGTALIDYVLRTDAAGQVSGCVRGDLGTVAAAVLDELAERFLAVLSAGTASPGLPVSELAAAGPGAAR